ncbi:MAG: hypothetical protein COV69_01695 [Parcubacteria group bacterium CG11_big_fil_rev_8_21_14_0_20_39_14]|nr:MAG: hypothetical protein COV69_01695 [Parcubacteria group bacterium CG11_big_fil_rev_8_21_14_0_20_39_14]PIS35357.1 MAG: hypothetical protein COT36_02765 [Parcubacteria group bacterium CG08_land_8_20_14_0_20_38_56]
MYLVISSIKILFIPSISTPYINFGIKRRYLVVAFNSEVNCYFILTCPVVFLSALYLNMGLNRGISIPNKIL